MVTISCKVDNQQWNGSSFYKSATYFKNGNVLLNTKEPFLQLAFKASSAPDDRQLTFQFKNFSEGVGVKNRNSFEVLLSGSASGDTKNPCLQSNWEKGRANTKHTDFRFEITEWKITNSKLIISGKFSGWLYELQLVGSNGCNDIQITEGSFQNLTIEIDNTDYEEQQRMMKSFSNKLLNTQNNCSMLNSRE